METIVKYKNRKYYSKLDKSYINLTDIAERITDGKEFQVLDANNKNDITKQTLVATLENSQYLTTLSVDELQSLILIHNK